MVSWILGLIVAVLQLGAPTLQAELGPDEPDASQFFEYASHWLDEDVEAALATTTAWHTDEAEELITPLLLHGTEPGAAGTFEGLHNDVQALLTEAAGFDFTDVEGLVVAGSEERVTAVVMGDIPAPSHFPDVELNGSTAYELELPDVPHMLIAEMLPDNLYAFPVDDPHPGLVLTTDIDELERIASARAIGDDASLATTDQGRAFDELFADTVGAPLAAAIIPEVDASAPGAPTDVDAAAVSVSQGFHLTLVDEDPAVLDELARTFDQGMSMVRAEIEQNYRSDDIADLSRRIETIYLYHTFEAVAAQLEPQRDENSLSYQVRFDPDVPWHSAMVTMLVMSSAL